MSPAGDHVPGGAVDAAEYLASQPPELRVPDALEKIRHEVGESGRRLVVLDDDPTGTQTVHGVPVLTTWSADDLRWALEQPSSTFYVLTNSRSFPEDQAAGMNREISTNLASAAGQTGTGFAIVSRGDSTLRGHYPAETDALEEGLGVDFDGVVLCPCYLEAGRLTVDDIHWVRQGERLVPAGETEFARDASFGYSSSNLAEWVEEKSNGRVPASEVASVGLSDIREGGPERVAEVLLGVSGGKPVVVNAASYADLEVFVLGLLDAEEKGKRFLYRTGPSLVRVRGGISEKGPLGAEELYGSRPRRGHGLVLVGSHVEMTTRQLEQALALDGVRSVELSVPRLLDAGERDGELDRVVSEVNRGLIEAEVVVYTSREVVHGGATGFEIGVSVSDALVEVMRRVDRGLPLAFVVAKGGITSSDVGTRGLGVRRAEVAGQMLPGIISVWILPDDSAFPGLPYVIFAGNVGEEDSLARVIEILREG
ncbi:MAG TPA: four-carbon acid sugar kinase family protein [Rubrobacter sp.]|nr:four-carbon acid sugar kinase family protein [Rubrobacter sp.]